MAQNPKIKSTIHIARACKTLSMARLSESAIKAACPDVTSAEIHRYLGTFGVSLDNPAKQNWAEALDMIISFHGYTDLTLAKIQSLLPCHANYQTINNHLLESGIKLKKERDNLLLDNIAAILDDYCHVVTKKQITYELVKREEERRKREGLTDLKPIKPIAGHVLNDCLAILRERRTKEKQNKS